MFKILIVDDSEFDREKMVRALKADKTLKFEFRELETGHLLQKTISEWQPNIVILDHDLPGFDGLELLKQITEQFGELQVPFIMATGSAFVETAVSAMKLGVFDYVVKDQLSPERIREVVAHVLEKSQYQKELINQQTLNKKLSDRFKFAQNAARSGTWEWNVITGETYWSENLWDIYGLDPITSNATFENWVKVIHPLDRDKVLQIAETAALKGKNLLFDWRAFNSGGELRWLQTRAKPLLDKHGKVQSYIGIVIDIDDEKKTEECLRLTQERLRLSAQAAKLGIFETDYLSGKTKSSPLMKSIWGFESDQEYSWEEYFALIHSEDLQRVSYERECSVKNRTDFHCEFRIRRKSDGGIRWIKMDSSGIHQEDSQQSIRVGSAQDVTEQKEAEENIQKQRELLETVVQRIPIAVNILSGPEFRIKLANPGYLAFAPGKEIIGRPMNDIWPEGWPELKFIHEKVLNQGEPYSVEDAPVQIRRSPDSPLESAFFSWSLSRILLPEENTWGLLSTFLETTTRKKLEQELREAISARDEFLAIASHELKTPLTSLRLKTQLYKRIASRNGNKIMSPEYIEKFIIQTENDIEKLIRLVEDMLDITRIRTGQLNFEFRTFNLSECAKDLVDSLKPIMEEARTPAIFECSETIIGTWDRFRIEQVITNLLTNAIRYGGQKPVLISLQKLNNQAILSVKDQGMGIEPSSQQKIFQRFERLGSATEVSGLGLGLFITKQIVETHHGKINVQSEGKGQGSTFIVTLPLDGAGQKGEGHD